MISAWFLDVISGIGTAMDPIVFISAFIGVVWGVFFGLIPGLGPGIAMAVAIPLTYTLNPIAAIGMLLGIYKGGNYGGSISAILINTPGTAAATATLLDGYPMALKGQSGKALKCALFASCFGDALSILILLVLAQPIAALALKLSPADMFALMFCVLCIISTVVGGNPLKGVISCSLGMLLACVGTDVVTGDSRFTFGFMYLDDGIPLIPMCIGLFAMVEVLSQVEKKHSAAEKGKSLLPPPNCPSDKRMTKSDWKRCLPVYFQSSGIGALIGALPGTGQILAAYLSYTNAKRRSKYPDEFGKGSVEGVAAAEAGNNAVCGGALIPLLTLGIPGEATLAIMLGALTIHGVVVGPTIFQDSRAIVFGIFGVLLVSIFMLAFAGFFFIWCGEKLIKIPQAIVLPCVVSLCAIGCYAITNRVEDLYAMSAFMIAGYFMKKTNFPIPPFIIGFVLCRSMEIYFRQAVDIAGGDLTVFMRSPISLVLYAVALFFIVRSVYTAYKHTHKEPVLPPDECTEV